MPEIAFLTEGGMTESWVPSPKYGAASRPRPHRSNPRVGGSALLRQLHDLDREVPYVAMRQGDEDMLVISKDERALLATVASTPKAASSANSLRTRF